MKQLTKSFGIKAFFTTALLVLLQLIVHAQQSPEVKVNNTDVGTWIGQNWLWVVGIIAVLIIILIASGGKRRSSKTTTVRRDSDGHVTTITTVKNE